MLKKSLFAGLFLIFIASSCVDLPEDLTMPRWDATLNIPLVDSVYTLFDAIEGDSQFVTNSDGQNNDLIYYTDKDTIDKIEIGENLTTDGFSTNFSQEIGQISVDEIQPVEVKLDLEEWTNGYITYGEMTVPPHSNTSRMQFSKIDQFEEVEIESADLILEAINDLPVNLELSDIIIRNSSDKSIIAQTQTENLFVEKNTNESIILKINQKIVLNDVEFIGIISTPGSNGETVNIPQNSNTGLKLYLENVVINRAVAKLPQQSPFLLEDIFQIDDSTYISDAIISSGNFSMNIVNNLPIDIEVNIDIPSLYNKNSTNYSLSILVRAEQTKLIEENSLNGWQIKTGSEINELEYFASFKGLKSDNAVEIASEDKVDIDLQFNEMVFESVSGQIKPTVFAIEKTEFELDMDEINNKLDFTGIKFSELTDININLESTAAIDMILNGKLLISNGSISEEISLDNVVISPSGGTIINLNEFGLIDALNKFSNKLPTSFELTGKSIVNPGYKKNMRVSSNDFIDGEVSINIPLDFSLSNGKIRDTMEVDLADIDDEDVESINSITLTMELENNIGAELELSGWIQNKQGERLLDILPEYNDLSSISIPAAGVDENGFTNAPTTHKQDLIIKGEDVTKFLNKPDLIFDINFATSESGKLVKFRSTDNIRYKLYGIVTYEVN